MAKKARRCTEVQAERTVSITTLDECVLVEVLRAACTARTLAQLATLSKQLCNLARSRVPVCLTIRDQEQASYVIRTDARGMVAFTSCTQLQLTAGDPVMCCMATGVLMLAQQWAELGQLQLDIMTEPQQQQPGAVVEHCASSILISVAPLQQLRRLVLESPALGACSAGYILQLTQLTYLQLRAPSAAPAAAADLGAMAGMTNLVELHLNWALAPHLPAGPEGPYCLPASLVTFGLFSQGHTSPAPMACWVAHLPGCPQLQDLYVGYGQLQHHSAHPCAVMGLLAQCNRELRRFMQTEEEYMIGWSSSVAGLPDAAGPVQSEWQPDAALAEMSGLERLQGPGLLEVRDGMHWQHLAQLTALRELIGVMVWHRVELPPGSTLRLVQLSDCGVLLGGYDVGRLLLVCPLLENADIALEGGCVLATGARLPAHPKLKWLTLKQLSCWGAPEEAAAHFAQLAPVLSGVSTLLLSEWPSSDTRVTAFPDLSPCTALSSLTFDCEAPAMDGPSPEQERFLSMVAPLVQLYWLDFGHAPRVNARVAFALQPMLPELQWLRLHRCGKLLPEAAAGDAQQQQQEEEEEQAALEGVRQLLRPGLVLMVDDEEREEEK